MRSSGGSVDAARLERALDELALATKSSLGPELDSAATVEPSGEELGLVEELEPADFRAEPVELSGHGGLEFAELQQDGLAGERSGAGGRQNRGSRIERTR